MRKSRKKTRRGFVWGSVLFLGVGLAAVELAYGYLYAPLFRVREVVVRGTNTVPERLVASLTTGEMLKRKNLAALLGPSHVAFWQQREMPRVLRSLPRVRSIGIAYDKKTKTVHLEVKERELAAVLCSAEGRECRGVDIDGTVFTKTPIVEGPLVLKILEENASSSPRLNTGVMEKGEWDNLSGMLTALREIGFHPKTVRLKRRELKEAEIETATGLVFIISTKESIQNKEGILREIMNKLPVQKLGVIDVRVSGKVYYH